LVDGELALYSVGRQLFFRLARRERPLILKLTQRVPVRRTLAAVVSMLVLAPPRGGVSQIPDVARVVAELEPAIQQAMIEGKIPSASVALVAGDRVVWTGAYGFANIWARTPAVPSTVYLIGSTFKAMSTVALLQQMEQGKFRLDDRVNDYLRAFKIRGEDASRAVTFRHLLTHTSGLPTVFNPVPLWSDTAPTLLAPYLSHALQVVSPPLDSVRYSNLAYTLIAHLVEQFSGMPYRVYIQKHIWDPLEMGSTAFAPTPEMTERLAVPYVPDSVTGRLTPVPQLRAPIWPAGLVFGTVLDQANWLIANLNGGVFKGRRIIGEAALAEMHRRQYDRFTGPMTSGWGNETAGYGLTWMTADINGERHFAHSGSVPGYTAFLAGNRDRKIGFAIMTNGNRAHPHLVALANRALALMALYTRP
jgi:CubicO group peptidase (beta-lactamase class C family)